MHNMKKLILSVFIFTFGFATATHAQQVNTLLTKQLPEAPGKDRRFVSLEARSRCELNWARLGCLPEARAIRAYFRVTESRGRSA